MRKLIAIFSIPELRNKLIVTLLLIVVYRIGIYLPLPGIDFHNIQKIGDQITKDQGAGNQLMTLFNLFSGGSLQNVAIFALGIMPYISASIILQLMTKMVPSLEALAKEGQSGRDKITSYTRYLTCFLCIVQGYMVMQTMILREHNVGNGESLYFVSPGDATFFFKIKCIVALTAGTMFLVWLGDQITEHGIGNGVSLIIMLGIVGSLPMVVNMMISQVQSQNIELAKPLILLIAYIGVVAAVVFITQGQRKLPIQYAKHTRGRRVYGMSQRTYFPIRVNMAGVMPVIFASSLLIFPSIALGLIPSSWGLSSLGALFSGTAWTYLTIYIAAVFFFSYFWNSLMFNPTEQADRMKEIGAFIPGFTPGPKTADQFEKIMNRMTLAGAAFLAAIAILPNIATLLMNMEFQVTQILGGTGLLIVAGVALEVVTKIESHLVMRNYDGFLKSGRIRGRR